MPTVLITGTSTGIGRVTAEVLAQRGWQVFATMRDLQRREKLEVALKKSGLQDRVEFIQLDLNDAASIEAAVATVLSRTGGSLDAVMQNAGVSAAGAFEDLPGAEIRRVMETNFFGVLELTRAPAADISRPRGWTHLVGFERGSFHGSAGKLDLLCLEMGARRLGRVARLRP